MTLERMTPELMDSIGEKVSDQLVAWLRSPDAIDVLVALLDPVEIGARWTPEQWAKALKGGERAGKLQRLDGTDEAWDIGDRDAWCLSSQPKEKAGDRAGSLHPQEQPAFSPFAIEDDCDADD